MLDEDLDVGLNMECGEDEETDSDVDNAYLEDRIWDDLEYNENSELDNSFGECSGYDSSSNEAGDIENDTGNSYEQLCVRGCDERGTIRRQAGSGTIRGHGRGRGTVGRGHGRVRGSGTDRHSSLVLVEMYILEEDVVQLVGVVYEDMVEDNPQNKI